MSKKSTTKAATPFTAANFRDELKKLLPGYAWKVHRSDADLIFTADGTLSSGFNRLSTIAAHVRCDETSRWYEVSGYGSGTRGPILGHGCGRTLAQAVRLLQDGYKWKAANFAALAHQIEGARKAKP